MTRPIPRPLAERLDGDRREARLAVAAGDIDRAWALLEEAHVLSQPWAVPHVRVHVDMLRSRLALPRSRRDRRPGPADARRGPGLADRPLPGGQHRAGLGARHPAHARARRAPCPPGAAPWLTPAVPTTSAPTARSTTTARRRGWRRHADSLPAVCAAPGHDVGAQPEAAAASLDEGLGEVGVAGAIHADHGCRGEAELGGDHRCVQQVIGVDLLCHASKVVDSTQLLWQC